MELFLGLIVLYFFVPLIAAIYYLRKGFTNKNKDEPYKEFFIISATALICYILFIGFIVEASIISGLSLNFFWIEIIFSSAAMIYHFSRGLWKFFKYKPSHDSFIAASLLFIALLPAVYVLLSFLGVGFFGNFD